MHTLRIAKSVSTAARPVAWRSRRRWRSTTVASSRRISASILSRSKLTVLHNKEQDSREQQATESSEQEWEEKAKRNYWFDAVCANMPRRHAGGRQALVQSSKQWHWWTSRSCCLHVVSISMIYETLQTQFTSICHTAHVCTTQCRFQSFGLSA